MLRLALKVVLFVFVAGFALSAASVSHAQQQQKKCMPYEDIKNELKKVWGESPSDIALVYNGGAMTVFRNPKTGTYTVVITQPATNQACVVSAGTAWKRLIVNKRGKPS